MVKAIPRKEKKPAAGKLKVATQIGMKRQGNSLIPIWILQFSNGKTIRWEGQLS